jgi:hypothetical protein
MGARGVMTPTHVFLNDLLGVIGIRVVLGSSEELGDRRWPFLEQLASKGIVVVKAFDEGRDCFIMSDSWDLETHIREATNVVAQRLACSITYALEVVLVARLVTCGNEIVDEGLPKVRPGVELVL